MRPVRCPCCGHQFDADAPMTPDALTLLRHAPRKWKRGQHTPIRRLAELSGMNYHRARAALQELNTLGYAVAVPYGKRGKVRYVGAFTMISRVDEMLAA